ncbi:MULTISPECIES: glycosyltransferase family 4 protein [Bradyrhizobium]|nr:MULTISPECIES: glycosyltransferase family 4 protein [Bradyrhizobium]
MQEVMRQIAERMAARGHDVTVATSIHPDRRSKVVNGVRIRAFDAGGKSAYGLNGEIEAYREFVRTCPVDAILIMAAQQWSFDALWTVFDDIKARKVFIPCGFSGLYEPDFADYFRKLPDILKKFDHLVFNAEKYRDIDFVRNIGLTNLTVLPNGISEADFEREADPDFRQRMAIPEDAFLFMTVGNPIEAKGHRDVVEAFLHLDTSGRSAVLLSIAGWPAIESGYLRHVKAAVRFAMTLATRAVAVTRREGWPGLRRLVRRALEKLRQAIVIRLVNSRLGHVARFIDSAVRRVAHIARVEGWPGIKQLALRKLGRRPRAPIGVAPCSDMQREGAHIATTGTPPPSARLESIESIAARASAQPLKRAILTDLTRPELIQAYMAADLFVFASRIEYSPLVLYEAAAAGTPFLTVPVGNADEIVRWTGSGLLCEASKDTFGYTRVDPQNLAKAMANCMRKPDMLARLGTTGRERWRKHFTWEVVAGYYEDILSGKTPDVCITDLQSRDQPALDPPGQPISSVA